ncbi:MAG TPA: hypothetical protein VHF22_02825, partial [Planctomycetota bacterium]|nr:hypothetical protein [Planctomycetota bacterium]
EGGTERSRALRANLVTLVQEEVRARLAAEGEAGEKIAGLADFLAPLEAAFEAEYTPTGVKLARWFVGAEVERAFATLSGFAPDPLDAARFNDMYASLYQALVFLAKRRLPDAVACERRARTAGAAPTPLDLLLSLLAELRRAGARPL